jgi:methylated-DNA-[protein]-cysteine S-methyltransferase
MEFWYTLLPTLAGPLLAITGREGLRHLRILPEADAAATTLAGLIRAGTPAGQAPPMVSEDPARFKALAAQLGEYFAGQRRQFDLPLAPQGTEFRLRVWTRIRAIPWGELRSYRQLAADLGVPSAARAVGQAAARNPLPILIPCHRVLGSGGDLVGFAGGTDLKARLLRLEGHTLASGRRVRPRQLF